MRPARIIVGQAAGSGADFIARLLAQRLSERLGQSFIVENRPGAAGNIATDIVVRAPADGYTFLVVSQSNTINATLYDKLNFDFVRDITPVASFFRASLVMVVNPSVPAKTVPEFIAYAKANPGKINMGSAGVGSVQHVAGELFKFMTGVDLLHVPYRGSVPAVTDLLAGQVQVIFETTFPSIPHIKAGRLRALAVTTAKRVDAIPDIPVLGDFVPGYEAVAWLGFGAPKDTPTAIVDMVNREINTALADPTIMARITALGGVIFTSSPTEFGRMIADETDKWGKVIRAANIKPA